jgi:hypothetical protein
MNPSKLIRLEPHQEVEFANEIMGDEAFHVRVKLNKDEEDTLDPASYIEHRWVETKPDQYALRVKNWTGSPVYVALDDIE